MLQFYNLQINLAILFIYYDQEFQRKWANVQI